MELTAGGPESVFGHLRFDPERDRVEALELIRGGRVAARVDAPTSEGEITLDTELEIDQTTWIALRASGVKRGETPIDLRGFFSSMLVLKRPSNEWLLRGLPDGPVPRPSTAHSGSILVTVQGTPPRWTRLAKGSRQLGSGEVLVCGTKQKTPPEVGRAEAPLTRSSGPGARWRTAVVLLVLTSTVTVVGACHEDREPGPTAADLASFTAQPTPEKALRTYMRVLELRVNDPDLTLYTSETRRLFANAGGRPEQQESELRSLRPAIDSMTVRRRGDLAVIRFSAEHRAVAPYFFRRGVDGWMLDLATASRVLVFNDRVNEWRFRSRDHEFAFAFEGG